MLADEWISALIARHTRELSRPEFLKAVRALSARYVEGRAQLLSRSPVDSAGKRAAFAAFFAPLHFLIVRSIVREVASHITPGRLLDLGCGTGVAAAAWACEWPEKPPITAIDLNSWALDETRWNARQLGLDCRTRKQSLTDALSRELTSPSSLRGTGIVCAWSVNELGAADRASALDLLRQSHRHGAHVLIVEPLAFSAVPWWESWSRELSQSAGRTDEWRFAPHLPRELSDLDDAAGFRRESLTARSIWLEGFGTSTARSTPRATT